MLDPLEEQRELSTPESSLHPPTGKFVKEKKIIFKRLQTILEDTYKRDFFIGGRELRQGFSVWLLLP